MLNSSCVAVTADCGLPMLSLSGTGGLSNSYLLFAIKYLSVLLSLVQA